ASRIGLRFGALIAERGAARFAHRDFFARRRTLPGAEAGNRRAPADVRRSARMELECADRQRPHEMRRALAARAEVLRVESSEIELPCDRRLHGKPSAALQLTL